MSNDEHARIIERLSILALINEVVAAIAFFALIVATLLKSTVALHPLHNGIIVIFLIILLLCLTVAEVLLRKAERANDSFPTIYHD